MDSLKEKIAKDILKTLSYDEMTEEQESIVKDYETEQYKKCVDELRDKKTPEDIENIIHEWWLNYEISDGTEDDLLMYLYKSK